jgi:hypothetical protein
MEPIPIKKVPAGDAKGTKTNIKQLKENIPPTGPITRSSKSTLEVTSSNHSAPSKRRQTTLITNIVKRPTQASRSHSAHANRKQRSHYRFYSPSSSSSEQWDVTTYYPANYHIFEEEKPTRYITEIYDKATNRYIPTTQ